MPEVAGAVHDGYDFRFCSKCGHEYDALAGKCPFCSEGQPPDFSEENAVAEARAALNLWGPWLRLGDAARETGIAFPTIAQATREGRLPFLQIGRQKFVRASAVRMLLSNQRGRPESTGLHRSRELIDKRRMITLAILKEQGALHPNDLIVAVEERMPDAYLESGDGKADCLNRDTAWLRDVLKAPIRFNHKRNEWEYSS